MQIADPLVTIGCAVYNGEQTLIRALSPLTEQTYNNLEILIADDRSTDGSRAICEEFTWLRATPSGASIV
jgi:glycosyltransferase involved in cell wall biosynthesis